MIAVGVAYANSREREGDGPRILPFSFPIPRSHRIGGGPSGASPLRSCLCQGQQPSISVSSAKLRRVRIRTIMARMSGPFVTSA